MRKIKKLLGIISIIPILVLALVGCVSATALSIEISSPQDGATVSDSPVTVTGTVSGYPRGEAVVGEQTARVVPEVTVNGVIAAVNENGGFSTEVELTEGENTIEAVALFNNVEARNSITVKYTSSALALTSIAVTPASPADLAVGATQQFTATGTYSDNSTADITSQATWASSDTAVATIDAAGLATGAAAGITDITASLAEVTSPAVTLTVATSEAILSAITVEPASPADLAVGATQQFTATGTYSDNSTADITSQATWASSDTAVATIDAAGLATGAAAGITDITASLSEVTSPVVGLTVVASASMLSVEITSPQDGAELDESQAAVTGTVSDAEATVTVNGVVVANNNGTFSAQVVLNEGENTITASILGELQAQDSVTVTYNPNPAPVPTVEITSPADGAVLSESLVTITGTVSPQGAVVTVNGVVVANHGNNGTFSAQVLLAEGDNTITAAAILGQGQLRAEASVTVTFTPTSALALTSIAVTPASPANLAVGATQQFTATGTYADNSTANVTSQVTWASSNTGTVTISAAGLATGVAAGTTNITASLSGVTSPVVGLTVVGPPTVSSTIPDSDATDVDINSAITATFSEAMDPLTVTDVTFTLNQGTTPVLGAVTYAGVTATFTPDVDLTASTNYTATITTGVEGLAGNALVSNFVWSFTTGE